MRTQIEQYEELLKERANLVYELQDRISDLKVRIIKLEHEEKELASGIDPKIESLEEQIKKDVILSRLTIKGQFISFVYNKRRSIDIGKFDVFVMKYPELKQCQTLTEYATIRGK